MLAHTVDRPDLARRLLVIICPSQVTRNSEPDIARRVNPQTDLAFSKNALAAPHE
jgi:hypothetical protein